MSVYALPGLSFTINGRPSHLQQAVTRLFHLYRCEGVGADLCLKVEQVPPPDLRRHLPEWLWNCVRRTPPGLQPAFLKGPDHTKATVAVSDDVLCCAWLDEQAQILHLVCTQFEDRPQTAPLQPVLMPLLRELLLAQGRLLIHGASVVTPGNRGLIFVAVSGGGKTTSALSVVRQGGRLLADDLTVLQPKSSQVRVCGIVKPLNVRKKTLDWFDELKPFADDVKGNERSIHYSTQATEIYGEGCMAQEARADEIYFLELSEGKPRKITLTTAESMRRLLLAHAFCAAQPLTPASITPLCEVLSHTPAYLLKTGSNPSQLGCWLVDTCERIGHG
jgi:hypothetical protein